MFTSLFLYQNFSSLVNTAQGSWFRPQTDFEVQSNAVSIEIWKDLTSKSERSQQERDYLRPFLKTKNVIVAKNNNFFGTMKLPEGYERFSAARVIVHADQTLPDKSIDDGKCCNEDIYPQEAISEAYYENISQEEVDLIDDQKWAACLKHKKKKPTLDRPKMLQIEGAFYVAPRTVSVVVLDFYILPKYATFKYTTSPGNEQTGAGDDIIFDTNSTPFDWPVSVIPEFMWRLAQRYGIFIEKEIIFNFATQQRQSNIK